MWRSLCAQCCVPYSTCVVLSKVSSWICQNLKFEAYGQFGDQFSGLGKTKQEEVILEDRWKALERRDKK